MPLLRPAGAGRLSMRLLLIRHAESQGNFERRLQGRREFPAYPGEEGRAAFQDRVRAAIRDVAERHEGDGRVAVITHAGPITLFLFDVLGREYQRPIPFVLDNASITTVEVNNGARSH